MTITYRLVKGSGLSNAEIDANFAELDAETESRQRKHGFEVGADGARLATISYNPATRVVTVTPTGSTFTFYIDGVKFTKTGAQTAPAHTAASGRYFIYYDNAGSLQVSTSPWSIVDRTVTPVAFVFYNHSLAKGIPMVELHGADRWLEGHKNLHFTQGTRKISGFGLSGFSLNTDTDDAVKFAVASGQIADEDLVTVVSALPDGGPYTVFYRTGINGDWTWDSTPTFPFMAGATYPQYNPNNPGGWELLQLDGSGLGTYCNYFLFAVPSVDAATQLLLVPGQVQHTSLSAAQAEGVSGIAWGTMPFEEIAPLYKITYHAKLTYGGTYNVEIVSVTEIIAGGASVISSTSPSVHNSLSSRDAADAHPASSITAGADSGLDGTTVQSQLTGLSTNLQNHTGYTVSTPHAATEVSVTGGVYTDVQDYLDNLDTKIGTEVGNHVNDSADAHASTAIGFTPDINTEWFDVATDDVWDALHELANRKFDIAGGSINGAVEVNISEAQKFAVTAEGSISIGGAGTPSTPNTQHVMLPSSGLIGSAAAGINFGENITYSDSAWRWVVAAAAGLYQINGGAHKFWTHTSSGSSIGGAMGALTERFRVDQGYTYNFQQFIQSSVAQITGTSTPPNGGGLELHWVAPDEAYVQALDRSGTTWKRLRLQGSDVQINPSNVNKGGADSNGLYGVAMQKAGDPSTTEIPSGYWRVAKNTSTGAVKLWYNDGGSLKSVTLS